MLELGSRLGLVFLLFSIVPDLGRNLGLCVHFSVVLMEGFGYRRVLPLIGVRRSAIKLRARAHGGDVFRVQLLTQLVLAVRPSRDGG